MRIRNWWRAHRPWLPVAVWMGFIFVMSTDLGSAAHTSRIIEPLILWIRPNASPEEIAQVHFLVRKLGHLSEYAVLALLALRAIRLSARPVSSRWSWARAGLALLIAAAYAATDEWHQSFVPGRTAALFDVLIDSSGASAGLTLAFFWPVLAFRRRSSRTTALPREQSSARSAHPTGSS